MIIHNKNVNQSISSSSGVQTAFSSFVICSKEDESRFLREQEERNRLERIKLVRAQEKEASKMKLQKVQEKLKIEKQQMEEQQKYQEYLQKKQEIEELKRIREMEVERAGKAMRDAEEIEEKRLRDELEKKEKAIRDEKTKKVRGKQALDKERQLLQEKKELEYQIKQIERKKMVQQQESEIAHDIAAKFRENETMKSKMLSELQGEKSKMSYKPDISLISKSSQLDYTNTRFHHALITRHNHESVIQEEIQKGAFEKAEEEATKKNIQRVQKENLNRANEQRAKERGKTALQEEIVKKDRVVFEKEMKKIQMIEGWEKIKEGMNNKDGNYQNGAYNEKKEKLKKERLLSAFEQEFIKPVADSNPQPKEINVPKPQKMSIRIDESKPEEQRNKEQETYQYYQQAPPQFLQNQQINLQFPQVQYEQESSQKQFLTIGDYQDRQTLVQNYSNTQVQRYPDSVTPYPPQPVQEMNYGSSPLQQQIIQQYQSQLGTVDSQQNQQTEQIQQQQQQQDLQNQLSFYQQQLQQYQQSINSQNFNTLNNPFFVPYPNAESPIIATPGQSAQPQYFNPYLDEIQKRESLNNQGKVEDVEAKIQINLNHPKHDSKQMVDQFLQDNKQYLQNQDDSELPSDYGEEEEGEDGSSSSSSVYTSQKTLSQGQKQSSSDLKSTSKNQEQEFYFSEINKIINDTKQNNKILNYLNENQEYLDYQQKIDSYQDLDDSSSIHSDKKGLDENESSYLSEKYLNSNYDQSKELNGQSVTTSYLAEEFLQDSQVKKSQNITSSNLTNSSISQSYLAQTGKTSYLKSSNPTHTLQTSQTPQMLLQSSSQQSNNQPKVFDYTQSLKSSQQVNLGNHRADIGQTPQSELSYSYSEMIGDMEGSNYMSSKMRLSQGSYLKNQTLQQNPSNNVMKPFNSSNNNTIQEEEDSSANQSQSQNSSNTKQQPLMFGSAQTPSFNTQQNFSQRQGGLKLDIMMESDNNQGSLADVFRQKKQQLLQSRLDSQPAQQQTQKEQQPKREKTKEELAVIRKQMMKQRPSTSKVSTQEQNQANKSQKEDPNLPTHLMSRLAKGEKAEITKKEMLKLTTKNYELLPEVKKKKEEERKKDELRERMKQVKELEKQRRDLILMKSRK